MSVLFQDIMDIQKPKVTSKKEEVPFLKRLVAMIGSIFAPIIPAIICGGLIIGLKNIMDSVYFFDQGTKTLAQMYPLFFRMSEYLGLIGNAVFILCLSLLYGQL